MNQTEFTTHYINHGFAEHRSTNSFDPLQYAAVNLDVAHAYGPDPAALIDHYLRFGINENRATSGFDAFQYAAVNLDVAHAYGPNPAALIDASD
jgi:hypothetical protein